MNATRMPAGERLITNGRTASRVFAYMRAGNIGTPMEIATALGLSRAAVWDALSRMRGAKVTRVLFQESTRATSGSPADVWTLEKAYATFSAADVKRTCLADDEGSLRPATNVGIVARALASLPPLAKVWMEARA